MLGDMGASAELIFESSPSVLDLALARQRLPTPSARREIRLRAGVSQTDVGHAVGASGACVSLWEREQDGREPRGARLVRYVSLLQELHAIGGAE
jgi:DNA-binding transcriptional regulator YiaG